MAPDLNTVPQSLRRPDQAGGASTISTQAMSPTRSRRTSSAMGPPPVPQNSSLPNSPRVIHSFPVDNSGVGMGPGPLRHPRPLTAAELHLELETEQEGMVNRLTRELAALRAKTASVASTTSSTSASEHLFSSADTAPTSIIPTSARRHRSSSSVSTRSARSILEATTNATSVSGVAAPREQNINSSQGSSRPSMEFMRPDISRQNSMGAASMRIPSGQSASQVQHPPHGTQSHRQSLSATNAADGSMNPNHPRSPSLSAAIAAARYEEAAFHRAELDAVKRENEALRQRIRDLERSLSGRE